MIVQYTPMMEINYLIIFHHSATLTCYQRLSLQCMQEKQQVPGNPNWRHTTAASTTLQSESHTVPHSPSWKISTRPLDSPSPPTNRIAASSPGWWVSATTHQSIQYITDWSNESIQQAGNVGFRAEAKEFVRPQKMKVFVCRSHVETSFICFPILKGTTLSSKHVWSWNLI